MDMTLGVIGSGSPVKGPILYTSVLKPSVSGKGELDVDCGGCGFQVGVNLQSLEQLGKLIVQCPQCRALLTAAQPSVEKV